MALLQISEPGFSPDPHQRRIAIGIDLGTTHSLVACVRNGVSECLPDEENRVLLPSIVRYLENNQRQIGFTAKDNQIVDPENTILSVKRLMGRGLNDLNHLKKLPYRFIEPENGGMLSIQTVSGSKSPVEISADILATLRYRAEDSFDQDIFGAVITVPAYFDDAQRQATKDAAQLAGIHVLRLINEPTAAAIAYGLDNASEGIYAIYDLGGGTFDISILRLTQGVFEVIATGGDSALGGDDFDQALIEWILSSRNLDYLQQLNPSDLAKLREEAKRCKEALTTMDSVAFSVELSTGSVGYDLQSADLALACKPLIKRTLISVRNVLRDAKLTQKEIKGVVMVGGSTRMPVIQAAVEHYFGQKPLTNLNPDEVVALGAAIQANQLAGNNPKGDLLLLDVIPLSLGLETMGGLVERIIPRNQTIPIAMAQDFTTYQDGQTALMLHVVQGERDLVADCRSLARFTLRGIPPMVAGAARIRVTFTVDADGLLQVSAVEQNFDVKATISVKPSYGLSDEQIAQMLKDSFSTAQEDIAARALLEARLDLDRLVLSIQSALNVDRHLLNNDELQNIENQIKMAENIRKENNPAQIEAFIKQLAQMTETFAAIRMNNSIQQVLSGKNIDQI